MKGVMIVIVALAVGFLGYKWYAAGQAAQRQEWAISDVRANIEYLDGEVKQQSTRLKQLEEARAARLEEMRKISALHEEISSVAEECVEYGTKIAQYEAVVETHRQERARQAEKQQANLDAMRAAREGRVLGAGESEAKRYMGKRGDFYFFQDGLGGWYARKELKGWSDEAMRIVAARDQEDAEKLARMAELEKRLQAGGSLSESEQEELDKLQKREQGYETRKKEAELKKEKVRSDEPLQKDS